MDPRGDGGRSTLRERNAGGSGGAGANGWLMRCVFDVGDPGLVVSRTALSARVRGDMHGDVLAVVSSASECLCVTLWL